jgi:hypothetical protein
MSRRLHSTSGAGADIARALQEGTQLARELLAAEGEELDDDHARAFALRASSSRIERAADEGLVDRERGIEARRACRPRPCRAAGAAPAARPAVARRHSGRRPPFTNATS